MAVHAKPVSFGCVLRFSPFAATKSTKLVSYATCPPRAVPRPIDPSMIFKSSISKFMISMISKFTYAWLIATAVVVCPLPTSTLPICRGSEPFVLQPGDRVVMLGDGLIEQEQYFGWIELMLTAAFPDREVSFRNIGWNADTPAGSSRFGLSLLQAGREPADEGWKQLKKQLEMTQPSVLILGYGMAAALEQGPAGKPQFEADMERLLNTAREISPEVRFVFLTPIAHADASNPAAPAIALYNTSVRELAKRYDSSVVDLSRLALAPEQRKDPIHLNSAGYQAAALHIAKVLEIEATTGYDIKQVFANPLAESLRKRILVKNQWFFHRSRPANMAYVFGFRKKEQGQNAVEIPQFDPLIAQEESRIRQLSKLEPSELDAPAQRLESKFAEFTAQPIPEFTIDPDWEITLWAQNPLLNKPIHMNFDPQGRLWVASSEAYPMIEVGQSPPDKVVVLEDSNGDGTADKSSVFAEGLLIPTGIAPGNGGVYVAQSTDLLFLKDTDGDGKADTKTRVLSGFGTEDTHHNLHTLKWGHDGRLYMNQSVYTRTDTETPHGVLRLKGGGGWRLDTQRLQAEVFFRGLWNSWGHQFDRYGQSFLTDGAGFAGIAYSFPGATFNPTPGARRPLGLISPGNWPKFASLEVAGGASMPNDWQGSLLTCDFRANRVTRFSLTQQDAGFVTTQEDDLVRTSAATFRPIDIKQGPDGALYIADWSNPIINHGEVDFRDPRRDRWHGRIWRVRWKGAPQTARSDFMQLPAMKLMDILKGNDTYAREQARRVLLERPSVTRAALPAWLRDQTSAVARLEGLWMHQGLDIINTELLAELLTAEQAEIRAAATRVLASWCDPVSASFTPLPPATGMEHFATLINDPHPRVRLEAVRGVTRLGTAEAAGLALAALKHPLDRFVEHALDLTVNELDAPLMEAIASGQWPPQPASGLTNEHNQQLEFVLTHVPPQLASNFLRTKFADEEIPADGSGPWIELIARAGGSSELDILWSTILSGKLTPAAAQRGLAALAEAGRLRKLRPSQDRHRIVELISSNLPDTSQASAVRLVGLWKMPAHAPLLSQLATAADSTESLRSAAISALRDIGGQVAADGLKSIVTQAPQPASQRQAIAALASVDSAAAVEPLLAMLGQPQEEAAALELWRGALAAKGIGQLLAAQLDGAQLSDTVLQAGLRATRDGGRDEPELAAVLAQRATMTTTAPWSPERLAEYLKLAASGDPGQGELVYRRQDLACVTCHAIGGIGGKVGPDMTSLGASAPTDYIIESLFDPNAKIKEGFHSISVATEDGRVFSGVETASDADELVLRDANDALIRIPQADIIGKRAGASLMPTGVIDRLSQAEQADLIAFLSQLGKPGRFDASQAGVARRFEIFAGHHRIEQQGAQRITSGEITTGWKPFTALVNGDVPKSNLLELTQQPKQTSLVHVYARTLIQQPAAGEVTFRVNSPSAALWIDGHQVSGAEGEASVMQEFSSNLEAGRHVVIVRLDARELPDAFRLQSSNANFAVTDEK